MGFIVLKYQNTSFDFPFSSYDLIKYVFRLSTFILRLKKIRLSTFYFCLSTYAKQQRN